MKNEKRLIDAYEALRMMSDSLTDKPFFNGKTRPVWEMAHDCAISCVVDCPTVYSVEVVHGWWKEWYPPIHMIMTGEELLYRCSACDAKYPDVEGYKYCPNCGAKMDGDGNG